MPMYGLKENDWQQKRLNSSELNLFELLWIADFSNLAVKEGFEPSKRYKRLHTFQACSFSHSDTSPRRRIITKKNSAAKLKQLI